MNENNTPPGLVSVTNLPVGAAAIANFASGMSATEAAVAASKNLVSANLTQEHGTQIQRPAHADQVDAFYAMRPELPDGVKEILPSDEPAPTAPISNTAPAHTSTATPPPSLVNSVQTPETSALEAQITVAQTTARALEDEAAAFQRAMDTFNLTEEKIHKILDQVILQGGAYFEQVTVIPNSRRVPQPIIAVFVTRSVDDYRVVNGAVIADQPQFDTDVSASTARANLACSLAYYGPVPTPDNPSPKNCKRFFDMNQKRVVPVQEALTWVGSLNQSLFSLLANELFKFDQRVALATSEYALRSFL